MNPYTWGRGDKRRLTTADFPAEVVALVEARMGGRFCEDCRALGLVTPADVPMELDHRQPMALGGDNHHLNMRWTCRSHNRGRAHRPLSAQPTRPAWERKRR